MSDGISFLLILLCILLSMYFSATETAFNSLSRIRMKNRADEGNKRAVLALDLLEHYDKLLSTILIGNNIVNIACTALATLLCVRLIGDEDLGATAATVIVTVVLLVFGEIAPKSIAKENPERVAMLSAPLLRCFLVVLTPLNWVMGLWQRLLTNIFKSSGDAGITEQELLTIVDEAEQGGGIDADESELIRSAIEFNELEVRDIYTPKIDIAAIPADISKEETAQIFSETGYSRLPVYEESIDNIVGILYHKDFYNTAFRSKTGISEIIKPVLFVPKSKKISDLRKELQEQQLHIAVVMDEFGCTVGIVTLEDILEELVGEIWDEHDEIVREILKLEDGSYLVSGKANIEKVFEELEIDPEFEAMTVSGWVMEILEKIPSEGDCFDSQGLHVTVSKMYGKRIEQVEIVRLPEQEPEDAKNS
ncbi:MAG: HlyC/CorC family transporter [Oscillospiraceae bacterium]|nr:HlyC/CorC family transporter [Oscillospiraceae bacterium]